MKTTVYQTRKATAREKAMNWQNDFNNNIYSLEEISNFCNYFYKLAKRYGLIREFRENGIL